MVRRPPRRRHRPLLVSAVARRSRPEGNGRDRRSAGAVIGGHHRSGPMARALGSGAERHALPARQRRAARTARPRPVEGALGTGVRAPAGRLGRRRREDRVARRGSARHAGWRTRRARLPQPPPQQAERGARPEGAGRTGGLPAAGRRRRCGRRELPTRREGPARHRLRGGVGPQPPGRLRVDLRASGRTAPTPTVPASTRSRRASAG